jgi:hypothetical protein
MIKTLNIIYQLLFMLLMHSQCKFMLYADHYMYLLKESKVKYQAHLCRIMNLTFIMLNHISLLAEKHFLQLYHVGVTWDTLISNCTGSGLSVRVHTACSLYTEDLYMWGKVDRSAKLTSHLCIFFCQVLVLRMCKLNHGSWHGIQGNCT